MNNKLDTQRVLEDKKLMKEFEPDGTPLFLSQRSPSCQQSLPRLTMLIKSKNEYLSSLLRTYITSCLTAKLWAFSVGSKEKFLIPMSEP